GDQRETSSCRHQHLYGLIVALESGIRHTIDLTIICSNDDVAAIDTSIGQSGIRRDCHSHRRAAARWDDHRVCTKGHSCRRAYERWSERVWAGCQGSCVRHCVCHLTLAVVLDRNCSDRWPCLTLTQRQFPRTDRTRRQNHAIDAQQAGALTVHIVQYAGRRIAEPRPWLSAILQYCIY